LKGLIVSNATPIIAFSRINKLDLFRQIVVEITIPQEVSKELYEYQKSDLPPLSHSRWIKMKKVKSHTDVELLLPSLDKGEAEVIVLSKELGASLVIIDELTARKVAIMMGLPVIGSVGLLIYAKKKGLIKEIKPLLDDMIRHGIHYKINFYRKVLKSINEL
jgi:predicted nucleic acid-binding protein